MNILIIIISLFLGFFARPAYAEDGTIFIDTFPYDDIFINQAFRVNIRLETMDPNTTFFYKFYGGIGSSLTQIQTNSWLDYNSDWGDFPTITTDNDGNVYTITSAYIGPNNLPGEYNLYVMLAYEDYSSPPEYGSSPYLINVSQLIVDPTETPVLPTDTPSPTITLTPTIIPTSIPTSIPTLIPTPTTSSVSQNQVPTLTPTPTINMSIFGIMTEATPSATPTIDESLLSNPEASNSTFIEAGSNPAIENEANKTTKKHNFLPIIFISFGALFLIIPLIVSKIKFKPKCLKK
jgi:hypothetical protein